MDTKISLSTKIIGFAGRQFRKLLTPQRRTKTLGTNGTRPAGEIIKGIPANQEKIKLVLEELTSIKTSGNAKKGMVATFLIPMALPFIPYASYAGLALINFLPLSVDAALGPAVLLSNLIPGALLTGTCYGIQRIKIFGLQRELKGMSKPEKEDLAQIIVDKDLQNNGRLKGIIKSFPPVLRGEFLKKTHEKEAVTKLTEILNEVFTKSPDDKKLKTLNTEMGKIEDKYGENEDIQNLIGLIRNKIFENITKEVE